MSNPERNGKCVSHNSDATKGETDRHTTHNKPFDAILNNVRSILETFRRVSVKCGAFILYEENNRILRRLLPVHHGRYIYSLTYITEFLVTGVVASSAPLFLPWQKSQSEGKFNPGFYFRVWKKREWMEGKWRGVNPTETVTQCTHVIIHHIFVIINCCFVTSPGSHTHREM